MSKLKWATSTAVLACTGLVGTAVFMGTAGAATSAPAASSEKTSATSLSAPAEASAAPATRPKVNPAKIRRAAKRPVVLSGKREVTIVRVQAFEGGLSLDGGELLEVDDDSGRQLFVPTPISGNKYLIKAYGTPNDHPANDEPACWQVYNPEDGGSLTVEGAVCDATNPAQRFKITASGKNAYAISNRSAFLQYFPRSGLILEELGDAPLLSTFRFVDNGPARTPAGG